MKRFLFIILVFYAVKANAVTISSRTYNYIWNPFTGTQQYVTSIDTNSITGAGVTVSSTNGGVLITAGASAPCGNSGDVQINFNGSCGGIGGGITGNATGGISSISVNNGIVTAVATGLPSGNTNYIQNSISPTSAIQQFVVSTGTFQIDSSTSITITPYGHIESHQVNPPTLTSCGGSPSIIGTDMAGLVTAGSLTTACTINFSNAWTNPPICVGVGDSVAVALAISTTRTTATVNGVNAGASFFYQCAGYR